MYFNLRNYVLKLVIIFTLATSSLFFSPNLLTKSMAATTQTGEVTASSLNMRSGPSTSYKNILTLKKGYKLTILEKKSGWYKVKYSNKIGWSIDDYIKIVTTSNATTQQVLFTGEVTASSLSVRASATTSSKIITTLKKGTKIAVVQKSNSWYKINTSKGYGWVSSKYVKQSTSETKPTTTPTPTKPTTPTTPSKPTTPGNAVKTGKVTIVGLNMRTGPATTYKSIKTLSTGTIVTIKSEKNGWYEIAIGTITGWASAKYIQLVNNENMNLANFVLVIDPGHGGSDPGTTFKASNGVIYKESMIVLKVSQYLKDYLSKLPIKTFFTRETDIFPSLSQRVSFAKSKNANAFISLHINSTPSHTGNGTETYYYEPNTSSVAVKNDPKLQSSISLAETVQKRLVEKLKLSDRGTKHGNFHVIRETTMTSILTELGFIDNPKDNEKLSTEYWQKEAAKGIYLGVLDFLAIQGYKVDSYYYVK